MSFLWLHSAQKSVEIQKYRFLAIFANFPAFKLGFVLEIEKSPVNLQVYL